tara:strand:- start:104 stop:460 length:357 start_codon:yes stop_codon:yes gene_type:complete
MLMEECSKKIILNKFDFFVNSDKKDSASEKKLRTLNQKKSMKEIQDKIIKIISEQLGKEESEINMTSNFVEDLDADSLDTVELVMALEEEFEIDIPDDAAEKITTVQSAVDFILEKTS